MKPLLFISDSPSCTSGLGRITRDLANRLHENCSDIFRVGVLGFGGAGSRHIPYPQYHGASLDELIREVHIVWEDFAGKERGIIMTIWDASRLGWLASPDPGLSRYAEQFEKWMYLPLDACGPNERLPHGFADVISGFDRVICYSEWAEKIVRQELSPRECTRLDLANLPHGIDTSVFQPRDKEQARRRMRAAGIKLPEETFLVGVVATNQSRKDFPLAFATCQKLVEQGLDARMWIHTDRVSNCWDIPALVEDFGMKGRVAAVTLENFSDEQMSWLYSACDVTLGIGLGEGWGFPIFESLACGVPCIHGNYGGAPENLAETLLVEPKAWRVEGVHNCLRPVFDADDWAHAVQCNAGGMICPPELEWKNLWPRWEQWFREGLK